MVCEKATYVHIFFIIKRSMHRVILAFNNPLQTALWHFFFFFLALSSSKAAGANVYSAT